MSDEARLYVKLLEEAPDGSRISVAEKGVLSQLAELHNAHTGCAWCSVKLLATQACITQRGCRRIIRRMCDKGVLVAAATFRQKNGGQSTNEYRFLALDGAEASAKQVEMLKEKQRTPRTKSPGGGGPRVRGGEDRQSGEPRTEGQGIENLRKKQQEETLPSPVEVVSPLPPSAGGQSLTEPALKAAAPAFAKPLPKTLADLTLAQAAWTGVMKELRRMLDPVPAAVRERLGWADGWDDWQEYRFGDLGVTKTELADGRLKLWVSTPDPKATGQGLEKYHARIVKGLDRYYGHPVELVLCPG